MTFSEAEKAAITSIWAKVADHTDDIGAEALERFFFTFPHTKIYFKHFDLSHGSKDLRSQGGKILNAIGRAAHHLDDIDHALSNLSDMHAQKLRVDPDNFRLLSHSIQVTLASHFPKAFNADTKAACDKFLAAVSSVLVSKY